MNFRFLTLGALVLSAGSAHALLQNYYNYAVWQADTYTYTTIDFSDMAQYELIGSNYAAQGVTFDSDDLSYYSDYVDGIGANGGSDTITLTFSTTQFMIGAHYPGAVRYQLYKGTDLVGTSADFGGSGSPYFAGVRSREGFDKVVIEDWQDLTFGPTQDVNIHNLYFTNDNVPLVPEPASILALSAGLMLLHRKRKLS